MNGKAERLGQTLHGKAHAMLLDSGLPESMIPELIATANYLRNRSPISDLDKTSFKKDTRSKPDLSHLQRIEQKGLYKVRRPPGANWPQFENRTEEGRLVGYEGNWFYRTLMPNGKVQCYSHVVWLNDKKRQAPKDPITANKSSVPRTGGDAMARAKPSTGTPDTSDNDEEVEGEPLEPAQPSTIKSPATEERLLQVHSLRHM